MKPYQRVALRFAKRHTLEYSTQVDFDSIELEVELDGEIIGEVMAGIKDYEIEEIDIEKFSVLNPCSDDIMELLSYLGGELLERNGKVRIVEVLSSELNESMKGHGIGYQMYLKVAQEAFDMNKRMPFLFLPNYCSGHSTSDEALRVWKSLARKYPSSGDVIAIRHRPSK